MDGLGCVMGWFNRLWTGPLQAPRWASAVGQQAHSRESRWNWLLLGHWCNEKDEREKEHATGDWEGRCLAQARCARVIRSQILIRQIVGPRPGKKREKKGRNILRAWRPARRNGRMWIACGVVCRRRLERNVTLPDPRVEGPELQNLDSKLDRRLGLGRWAARAPPARTPCRRCRTVGLASPASANSGRSKARSDADTRSRVRCRRGPLDMCNCSLLYISASDVAAAQVM